MNPTAMLAVEYASHARQVKGDDPDKKACSCPPGWGSRGADNPHTIKIICSETQQLALERWETDVDERSLETGFDNSHLEC